MTVLIPKPDLPGSALGWIGEEVKSVPPSFNEVVAIVGVHDSGPLNIPRLYPSFAAWEAVNGNGDTPGRDAVLGAFHGMGVPGGGGAGGVMWYRAGTAAAAAATRILTNTNAAANALTLTALYKGVRGNSVSVVHEDDPAVTANDRLRVLFNGATVEKYSYVAGDVASLVSAINLRPSAWVTAAQIVTGVALTHGTFALTGGNDGAVLTAAEWLAAQNALEYKDFGLFAPFNVTDPTIKAQLRAWVQTQALEQRPFRAVFGGAAGETVTDAITDAGLVRDEHIMRFGVGTYHDDMLGKDVSTAQLAPRIAGILAARGLKSSATRAEVAGLTIVSGAPATDELKALRDAGVMALRRTASVNADLVIAQGVTTFNSKVTAAKPYDLWSDARIIGLLDYFQRRMTAWGDEFIVGDVTVSDDSRAEVRKEVQNLINELIADNLVKPGTDTVSVQPDPSIPDGIPYEFGFQPTRTANYLIGQGRIK